MTSRFAGLGRQGEQPATRITQFNAENSNFGKTVECYQTRIWVNRRLIEMMGRRAAVNAQLNKEAAR